MKLFHLSENAFITSALAASGSRLPSRHDGESVYESQRVKMNENDSSQGFGDLPIFAYLRYPPPMARITSRCLRDSKTSLDMLRPHPIA